VGWRVVKRASATSISIALQAVPSSNDLTGDSEFTGNTYTNPGGVRVDHWGWAHLDDAQWFDVVEIDVTPKTDVRFGATPGERNLSALEPEWLANTWHWVVVNYGYARDKAADDPTDLGFAQFDMSLQVDMNPTQPPRASDPSESAGRIAFLGDPGLSDGYGELHGHEHLVDGDMPFTPMGHRNNYGNPITPFNSSATHLWLEPRPLGDYYNCRTGTIVHAPDDRIHERVVTWNADLQTYQTSQAINFPAHTFDHKVFLRYPDGTEREMTWSPGGGSVGSNGFTMGNWTYNFLGGPPGDDGQPTFDYGADGMPGTADDVPMDIILRWTYAKPDAESPYCVAQEISTPSGVAWDGTAKQVWQQAINQGLNVPEPGNGDNQCVSEALIHGRPIVKCNGRAGDPPRPCWTVTNTDSQGQGRVINIPGWDASHRAPAHMICDGCRGCENCDVDGPLFVGGEPKRAVNYRGVGGPVDAMDPNTIAHAVFDNLVIKNLREFEARTDYASKGGFVSDPSNPGFEVQAGGDAGTPQQAVDWYEDRFYEMTTAAEHFTAGGADPAQGFGATYRRGLLELVGLRTRLGSMTWTSYPTSDRRMQFEVSMFKLDGQDAAGEDLWKGDRGVALASAAEFLQAVEPGGASYPARSRGQVTGGVVTGYRDGLTFGNRTRYDGVGNSTEPYEILMFRVQLGSLYQVGSGDDDTGGAGTLTVRQDYGYDTSGGGLAPLEVLPTTEQGLPTPIVETPVFEDITFNFLRETPQILYAEEGVAE
jgi:hypothetical protein